MGALINKVERQVVLAEVRGQTEVQQVLELLDKVLQVEQVQQTL